MLEEWKEMDGLGGLFEISNIGRIREYSCADKENAFIRRTFDKSRYKDGIDVTLYYNNLPWVFNVRQLVAEYFVPNPRNLPKLKSIDGNINNFRADNLYWAAEAKPMVQTPKKIVPTKITISKSVPEHREQPLIKERSVILALPNERWIPCEEGLMQISNMGRVKTVTTMSNSTLRAPKLIPQYIKKIDNKSYHFVDTSKGTYKVDELVGRYFLEEKDEKLIHLNGNTLDDRAKNLSWGMPIKRKRDKRQEPKVFVFKDLDLISHPTSNLKQVILSTVNKVKKEISMMEENWKVIPEFKNYEVSDKGNIRRKTKLSYVALKTRKNADGDTIASTTMKGKYHCFNISQLQNELFEDRNIEYVLSNWDSLSPAYIKKAIRKFIDSTKNVEEKQVPVDYNNIFDTISKELMSALSKCQEQFMNPVVKTPTKSITHKPRMKKTKHIETIPVETVADVKDMDVSNNHMQSTLDDHKWAEIKGTDGKYQLCTNGSIRRVNSLKAAKKMSSPFMEFDPMVKNGTKKLSLNRSGKQHYYNIAELMLETFKGVTVGTKYRYKDGNRMNVALSNLELR